MFRSSSLNWSGRHLLPLGVLWLLVMGPLSTRADLIIGFEPGATFNDRARALKNSESSKPLLRRVQAQHAGGTGVRTELVRLPAGLSEAQEIARLEQLPGIAYVEPNYRIQIFTEERRILPNDFDFERQYALLNHGSNSGKTNAHISAPQAWALTTGSRDIIVAVIDTGVDYFHEDLRNNLWRNPGEIPNNGIDDDGNGFIDDYFGYDFVSNDSDPFDDNDHGTHVTGIIAAQGDNQVGIAGVCWEASVMTIKAFDQDGNGTVADAIAAIQYAVANGARIINASWGIDEKSRALEEATQYAADAGVLFVAAAGNGRTDAPAYPASFESALSVAATDHRDNRAGFSNYGVTVDVAAPGAEIFSTLPENRYGLASGTSMAAPHVSGVAALVLARFPNYSREELFNILVNSVDAVLFDQPVGAGRLNAFLAVQMDQPLPIARLSLPPTLSGALDVKGTAMGSFFAGYELRVGQGLYPTNWIKLASSTGQVNNGRLGGLQSAQLPDGTATVQLVVTNRNGLLAVANASLRILNTYISSPASGDVVRPAIFPVRGAVIGDGKGYELAVGSGLVPTDWRVLSTGVADGATNVLLGEWDASQAAAGFYALRLTVEDGGQRSEFLAPTIYIDRELKEGWPVYLPVDRDFPPTDWRNVRVADLDGDGKAEIILADAGTKNKPQQLLVYSHDGHLKWSRTLGFDIPPDLPAIGDIDGDGQSEIFVDGTNGIVAFHFDGRVVSGWPVATRRGNHAKVLADLDGNGEMELISYSQEYAATQVGETRELSVYRANGNLVRTWELPWCGFTNAVQKIAPAVANIDDDPVLEIVVPSGCQQIAAFDFRQAEPKWRGFTQSPILSSPVIGDVNGDGVPDVIVGTAMENGAREGGVYAWDGSGQPWLGFPVLEEYSFITPPALADLDQDGRLEIILSSFRPSALHVLQWDGFNAEGWPRTVNDASWYNTVSAADVNNDGRPDALLTAPGYLNLANLFQEYRWVGGISAFQFSGEEIRLSGNDRFKPRLLESATSRYHRAGPVVVCDLDDDGRMDFVSASVLDRTYGTYTRVKERSSIYAWDLALPLRAEAMPWPMFGHDPQNTGAYSLPIVVVPPPTNATVAVRDRVITVEDHPVLIQPLRNDYGPDLRVIEVTQGTNGSVTLNADSTVLYAPATNASGFDSFSYTIRSSSGPTSTGQVVVRVKPVNDAPVVNDMKLEINKNSVANFFFDGTDAENDPLTFRIITTPKHGEAWNYPTVGVYYPKKGFHGVDSFHYVANDGKIDSAPGLIEVTVLNSNNPPTAVASEVITKTNRSIRISPRGEDIDGDPLEFELVSEPRNGNVEMDRGAFVYLPKTNFVGSDSFQFRAFDGTAHSEPALIRINVIITNIAPRAIDSSLTVQPNSTNALKLNAADSDGDELTFTLLTLPAHGTLEGEPPNLNYIPRPNYEGPDRLTFKVADPYVESEPGTVSFRVERRNRPPEAIDQITEAEPNVFTAIGLNAFDPDGDAFHTIILKGPTRGRIFGSGTNFVYRPNTDYVGPDRFTYKLWDGQRFGRQAVVSINVMEAEPEAPLSIVGLRPVDGAVELTVRPGVARAFTLQSSTNLSEWTRLAGPFGSNRETETYRDTNAHSPRRFYRAVGE